jgi:retron-type reverse transcriptase
MLLDASQAFDMIEYTRLMKVLLKREICHIMARTIAYLYINQKIRIRKCHSEYFNVSNGVKQGGILSPFLFVIYMDELLSKLNGSGFGCHIGINCAGVYAYADDIIILCPNKFYLTAQLEIAVEFSKEYIS